MYLSLRLVVRQDILKSLPSLILLVISSIYIIMNLNSKYIVVGAGFFGAVIAERIANVLGEEVILLEKRSHLGGNAYTYFDPDSQADIHQYGSHIFHTNNKKVWDYINQFTAFNQYRHKVWAKVENELYPMPVNLNTISQFFKHEFNPESAKEFIDQKKLICEQNSFEGKALGTIGVELYEAFFKGYTQKQWQTDPKLLPASTFSRLPLRFTTNSDYFDDPYQGIPIHGYTEIFEKMLTNPKIKIYFNTDFFDHRDQIGPQSKVIYSGPIDRYFNYQFGELGWRTLDFTEEKLDQKSFQGTTVVNYPQDDVAYTRIHEFKYYTPEKSLNSNKTVIFKEYSRFANRNDDPYYPINTDEDQRKYRLYEEEAKKFSNLIIGGRLGQYKYYDMHHVIAMALKTFEDHFAKE